MRRLLPRVEAVVPVAPVVMLEWAELVAVAATLGPGARVVCHP